MAGGDSPFEGEAGDGKDRVTGVHQQAPAEPPMAVRPSSAHVLVGAPAFASPAHARALAQQSFMLAIPSAASGPSPTPCRGSSGAATARTLQCGTRPGQQENHRVDEPPPKG
jgi:hypothetical protein